MSFNFPIETVEAIRAWKGKIRPDPLTGKVDMDTITQYIWNNLDDPDIMRTLEHAKEQSSARDTQKKDLGQIDLNALPMEEHTIWMIRLHFGGLRDANGRIISSRDAASQRGAQQWFHLYSHIQVGPGMEDNAYRMMEEYPGMPTSKQVEDFIRGSMAIPYPVYQPCIPHGLVLSANLNHHEAALRPFLDSFPSPFWWQVLPTELEDEAKEVRYEMEKYKFQRYMKVAKEKKDEGNKAYGLKNSQEAVKCYEEAIDYLDKAVSRLNDGDNDEIQQATALQAVCFSNSSIARLNIGGQENIEKSIEDAQSAIRLDKSYGKGYLRLSRACEAQGHFIDAEEAILKALRLPELENNQGLVDHLISLQTRGKGLPADVEGFKEWYKETFSEGAERAKRMHGVGGLWLKICKGHVEKMRSATTEE